MSDQIHVVKFSGEREVFDPARLRGSLERSGAGESIIEDIVGLVERQVVDGMSTRTIYKTAFNLLRRDARQSAARYKLKQAIFELGPSGFPFERFVGELLKHQGYQVTVGVQVQGRCVSHEVDVEAKKDNKHFMVECKFHSDAGRKCDVKIPLYIQSRFEDIESMWRKKPGHGQRFHQGWLVTNTRFTTDAIEYGQCARLNLISWDFPKNGSLRQRIDLSGLYPLTCITSLTKREKQALLNAGVVLARDLRPELLEQIGARSQRVQQVQEELNHLTSR